MTSTLTHRKEVPVSTITIDEFESLSNFIYRKAGIRFESKKIYFVSKRIQKRMSSVGLDTVSDYIRLLRFADPRGAECQNLIDSLTINETYFFRDFQQLQAFAEHCLPEVVERKKKAGEKKIKIWSAPCSSGEEPYTLGIIFHAVLEDIDTWDIEIAACDIDRTALEKAKRGVYAYRSVRDVPRQYLETYFNVNSPGIYQIKDIIKKMVRFEHMNLADKETVRRNRGFDFIFCRNLLIYFDDASRKQLVDQFYVALNPGGFIFLGSSESIGRISTAFRMKRVGGFLVYCRNL